jgi:hypothetical protein
LNLKREKKNAKKKVGLATNYSLYAPVAQGLAFLYVSDPNQHKTSCEMSAGESKCSTII